jgi:UDP-N-acetylmuramoyl-L-alanyl-D-glutamate--2,6-diaminopimelate ligase
MWQCLKNKYHWIRSLVANIYYGFPGYKLTVIGVTGTSGKTTTTLMIYEVLKKAGYKVSVLSTIKAVIGGLEYDTGFHVTTPDPMHLSRYLNQAVRNNDQYFVLEVSSHALDQNRVSFIPFKIGVLTSLAHEHLDYHKTFKNYTQAKFKLLHSAKTAIVPINILKDDKKLSRDAGYDKLAGKVTTYGLTQGDQTQRKWHLKLKMIGDFNVLNALAAAASASLLGVEMPIIQSALANFSGVLGRFEEITNSRGLRIVIDFAHKPDALQAVLKVAQKTINKGSRIIVMYGCASERDLLKRSIMGKISAMMADITVLTDEDPRREDRIKIIDEIAKGCIDGGAKEVQSSPPKADQPMAENIKEHIFYKIPDRQKAIDFIINKLAKKGDVILLCGKGHEKSINYNGVETPWSEHEAVRKALGRKVS